MCAVLVSLLLLGSAQALRLNVKADASSGSSLCQTLVLTFKKMEIGNVISCIHSKPINIQWIITGSHPNENNMYSIVFYHVFYKYKNYVLISLPVHSGT